VHSKYQPARRLWVRSTNGHYFPNPQLLLRAGESWQSVYERLAIDWIDRGCGSNMTYWPRPSESLRWTREALARDPRATPAPENPGRRADNPYF
jgi:hypothetical protein